VLKSSGTNLRRYIGVAAVTFAVFALNFGLPLAANSAQTQNKTPVASKPKTSPRSPAKTSAPAPVKISIADIEKAKSLGPKNAPILVEIFSDFQCPQCKNFFLGASRRLLEDYAAAGKVYFVHHDFPLPIPAHVHSQEAARWANAAAAIGKFHEVERALYTNQDSWGATGKIEELVSGVLGPANLKRVKPLVDGTEVKAAVKKDMDLGDSRNVGSTPSIYVTHGGHTELLPPSGTSYNLLKPYLDYLLQH
jgi:protein-disulfide isomerase